MPELFPAHDTVLQGCTQPSTQEGAQPIPRATIWSIENPGVRPRCTTPAWGHVSGRASSRPRAGRGLKTRAGTVLAAQGLVRSGQQKAAVPTPWDP